MTRLIRKPGPRALAESRSAAAELLDGQPQPRALGVAQVQLLPGHLDQGAGLLAADPAAQLVAKAARPAGARGRRPGSGGTPPPDIRPRASGPHLLQTASRAAV